MPQATASVKHLITLGAPVGPQEALKTNVLHANQSIGCYVRGRDECEANYFTWLIRRSVARLERHNYGFDTDKTGAKRGKHRDILASNGAVHIVHSS